MAVVSALEYGPKRSGRCREPRAAAGGGGRGMRRVEREADIAEAFARCQGEAQAAFGDGSVFVEKFVARPRHIEVQVLGDGRGVPLPSPTMLGKDARRVRTAGTM